MDWGATRRLEQWSRQEGPAASALVGGGGGGWGECADVSH